MLPGRVRMAPRAAVVPTARLQEDVDAEESRFPRAGARHPAGRGTTPIVSSAHLVSPQSAELSEFEFGLIVAGNAFHRWIAHCMSAAGLKDLTPLDVLVLHHVTHRARDKRLADICFIMNVEDTHLINYALKKLQNLGVVVGSKNGKEVTYASTEARARVCAALPRNPRGLPDQRAESRRRPEPRHR